MQQSRLVNLLLAAGVTLTPCLARKPGEPLKPGFNLFSKQQDIELGQEAAAQVRQKVTVVQNQFLQDYVQRVGKRLTAQPEATGWPFNFTVDSRSQHQRLRSAWRCHVHQHGCHCRRRQ